jgi:hypothetical protein
MRKKFFDLGNGENEKRFKHFKHYKNYMRLCADLDRLRSGDKKIGLHEAFGRFGVWIGENSDSLFLLPKYGNGEEANRCS